MAKAVSAKATAKRLRRGPTFIQRSRQTSSEQKAIWHNVTGAGRSRVMRPFFELGDQDQAAIKDGIERLIQARITQAGA